ncbi:hypothetical protein BO94DRAFT_57689 [Aspergillus sclerotioniger CBS 115572]|uniref:Uncharacterized protein n=1 Tax=Aspergillus sclerotioniger CBS 115572 TaxID=1450535 RepID=A0A317WQD5_9EURO|nr:hypothetical protein BO94DRAFT_57689 [Aspergillus sclerotioniger CBS 115572]PWY87891.1 hypothetical protein BO94DRAFT_57689 [Aspergillus sclerotioniger CBS 115572]
MVVGKCRVQYSLNKYLEVVGVHPLLHSSHTVFPSSSLLCCFLSLFSLPSVPCLALVSPPAAERPLFPISLQQQQQRRPLPRLVARYYRRHHSPVWGGWVAVIHTPATAYLTRRRAGNSIESAKPQPPPPLPLLPRLPPPPPPSPPLLSLPPSQQ